MLDTTPTPVRSLDSAGQRLLSTLLLAANRAIASDLEMARICLVKATALLGDSVAQQRAVGDAIRAKRGGLAPWQAEQTVSYIEQSLGEGIRVSQLATHVGLSPSHFFRAFKETFGEAPMLYVARRRIVRAQELMASSQRPLAQIALECGLCDQAHFTRLFKRVVGHTPSAWRRNRGHSVATC